jgi:putative phage-type endonuclease
MMSISDTNIDKVILRYLEDIDDSSPAADKGTENLQTIAKKMQTEMASHDYDAILERLKQIKGYRHVLQQLRALPFVKQRSQEWFDLRKDRLTASDLYDAIKGGAASLSLAKKKAGIVTDTTNYNGIPALKWGTMFEPMASRCYSQLYNDIQIYDFGLVCDKNNEHFGASPDGITELGVMIEIKCPISRKIIDDVIPVKYQMQIQGQLAVCSLEECDYIECDFKTFEDDEEYLQKIGSNSTINHGVIAEFMNENREYYYLYSDASLAPNEALLNIEKQMTHLEPLKIRQHFKKTYWYLNKINVQKVHFNHEKWQEIVPKIYTFWEQVEQCKLMPKEPAKQSVARKLKFIDEDD